MIQQESLKKRLAKLAAPIFIETLLIMMLGAVDTIMLSRHSDENEAADILVQQEGYPHAADTPAEGKAEKVSHTYSYTPLHHQPYVEGVVDISCRTKGVGGEDVDGAYPSSSTWR